MRVLKLLFIAVFSFFIIFIVSNKVQANSINSITMDIYINNSGTAHITETWNCNTTQGTEVYHPYYNLGNSSITNLTVTDGNIKYTTLNTWNPNGSFNSKQYKCGINRISNGVELCWGISSFGNHTYKVSYNITNFVSELTDSQMAYWTLIPYDFSNEIGSVDIKIHSDVNFPRTLDVWTFGQYGARYGVQDGYIELKSNGTLSSSEYITILAKFPLGTFSLSNKLNNDFQYYLDMAQVGSTTYVPDNSNGISYEGNSYYSTSDFHSNDVVKVAFFYVFMSFFIIFSLIIYIFIAKSINSSSLALDFSETGKKLPSDVPYFRNIPYKGDIFRAYFIAHNYGLMKNKTDFLGTILLKWLKEDKIKIEKRTARKSI